MNRDDLKRGQILYKYERGLHDSDGFVLRRYKVTQLGQYFMGYVHIGKNDEPRSGLNKTSGRQISFEASPAAAKERLVAHFRYELQTAERRVKDAARDIETALAIALPPETL